MAVASVTGALAAAGSLAVAELLERPPRPLEDVGLLLPPPLDLPPPELVFLATVRRPRPLPLLLRLLPGAMVSNVYLLKRRDEILARVCRYVDAIFNFGQAGSARSSENLASRLLLVRLATFVGNLT